MPRAERRLQLLAVAREIVEEEGIGALTMSALAHRSGAAKPIVYEHFENSEAVAVALLENYFESISTEVFDRVKDAETIDEYMNIVIDSLFDIQAQHRSIARKITNGFSSSVLLNGVYMVQNKKALSLYEGLLQQQGVSKNVARVAAYGLAEIVTNVVLEFSGRSTNSLARETLKRMVSGLIHSLAPEAGSKPYTPSPGVRHSGRGRSKRSLK